jgi:hypothetical protein
MAYQGKAPIKTGRGNDNAAPQGKKSTIDYVAYAVTASPDGDDEKTRWKGCGVVFKHKESDGFTVLLDTVPLSGKLVLLPPKEDDERGRQ